MDEGKKGPAREEVMGQDSHDVPDVADAPEHEEDGGDLA